MNKITSLIIIFSFVIYFLTGCDLSDNPDKSWNTSQSNIISSDFNLQDKLLLLASEYDTVLYNLENQQPKLHFGLPIENKLPTKKVILNNKIATIVLTQNIDQTYSDSIWLWDHTKKHLIKSIDLGQELIDINISPTNKIALIALSNNQAIILNLESNKILFEFPKPINENQFITTIALSNTNRYALLGYDNGVADVWDLKYQKIIHTYDHFKKVSFAKFINDNQILISATQYLTEIYDIYTGKIITQLTLKNKLMPVFHQPYLTIRSTESIKDKNIIITASPPSNIRAWDIYSGKLLQQWFLPKESFFYPKPKLINSLAYDYETKTILAQTTNGKIYGYNYDPS